MNAAPLAPNAELMPIASRTHVLPLVILPDTETGATPAELTAWVRTQADRAKELRLRHGALLFRGFGFEALRDFEEFVSSFACLQSYVGGVSQRTNVEGKVYTSTDMAAHYEISLHHESAYTPCMPAIIGFMCAVPAATGGQTPLADSRRITARLPAELRERFTEKGLRYINNLPDKFGFGKSWQAQFETEDREEAEAILAEKGYEWEWKPEGGLRTCLACDALLPHPETGERLWVNQSDHWHPSGLRGEMRTRLAKVLDEENFPTNVTFGDGSPIDEADLAVVRAAVAAETVQFDWMKGDVLLCDNYLVSHGRRSFTGERKVYTALG